jgi:hypothetical protein
MAEPKYTWRVYDHPQKFLLALRGSNPEWSHKGNWRSHWIFRGCASASWNLIPSAWLKLKFKELYEYYLGWEWDDLKLEASLVSEYIYHHLVEGCDQQRAKVVIAQVLYERELITEFCDSLDRMGFPVPGFTAPVDDHFMYRRFNNKNEEFPPIFALAQHHGVPTRLLDWTLNPLKAVFFAASPNPSVTDDDELAVWAWDIQNEEENNFCQLYKVQRSHVGYLSAQEGLFSYMPTAASHYLNHGEWPHMEDWILHYRLIKLSISRKHASELLRLLHLEGITHYSLMPTHDNITKSIESVMKYTIKPGRSIYDIGFDDDDD